MSTNNLPPSNDIIFYASPAGDVRVEVFFQEETFWLNQKKMAELFGVDVRTVNEHLKNTYKTNELDKDSTIRNIRIVQKEGNREVSREVEFYNLDAIIAVGYRVNSSKATQFRIWATQTLKEFIIKGFVLDDNRLKQGRQFGKDYFKELLNRIRSIRASERRVYQQITDVFAECSIDYDKNSILTKDFYATIQNKFHFAIVGKTAAEIIYNKANASKENMGLTNWKYSPDGRILKQDVIIAKNYLEELEIKQLERTIVSYFDYIEGLVERQQSFTMQQLADSVNKFLNFNDYKILDGKGKVSKLSAAKKAITEYDQFNKTQKIISDFDKIINK